MKEYPWARIFRGNRLKGWKAIARAARVELAPPKECLSVDDQDAASAVEDLVVIDRLLLAAAKKAQGRGMCSGCYQTEARRAYYYADKFKHPDDLDELVSIAEEDAIPCECPAGQLMPYWLDVVFPDDETDPRD